MSDLDVAELVSFFLSAFALGMLSSYLFRVFLRVAGLVAR